MVKWNSIYIYNIRFMTDGMPLLFQNSSEMRSSRWEDWFRQLLLPWTIRASEGLGGMHSTGASGYCYAILEGMRPFPWHLDKSSIIQRDMEEKPSVSDSRDNDHKRKRKGGCHRERKTTLPSSWRSIFSPQIRKIQEMHSYPRKRR